MVRLLTAVEVPVPARLRPRRRLLAALLLLTSVVGLSLVAAPQAGAKVRWAAAHAAPIHPGVQTYSPAGQCTANFVFHRPELGEVYIGQAAHCTGTGMPTDTNGCEVDSLPLGTPVEIDGATKPGTLVYNSWLAMDEANEQDPDTCAYNDFALVRIDPADHARVNPTLPHWGGPTAINYKGLTDFSSIYSVGNSSLRQGIRLFQPRAGRSLATSESGWVHQAYTLTPGIPGDSGSAMVDGLGRATGVLSTIEVTPLPASNLYIDLSKAMRYAQTHGMPRLRMGVGTVPFNPNKLPLG